MLLFVGLGHAIDGDAAPIVNDSCPGLNIPIQGFASFTGAEPICPSPYICFLDHPILGLMSSFFERWWASGQAQYAISHACTEQDQAQRNTSVPQDSSLELCWLRVSRFRRRANDALPSLGSFLGIRHFYIS